MKFFIEDYILIICIVYPQYEYLIDFLTQSIFNTLSYHLFLDVTLPDESLNLDGEVLLSSVPWSDFLYDPNSKVYQETAVFTVNAVRRFVVAIHILLSVLKCKNKS